MALYGRLSLLLAIVVLAACGSSHARRDAVNAYFQRVDAAESDLLSSVGEIDGAFQAFAMTGNKPAEVHELAKAQSQIHSTLVSVRAVYPPPDATKVHADLVKLLALQDAVAHELYWATQFEPRYTAAAAGLHAAAAAFTKDLQRVAKPGSGARPPHLTAGAALEADAAAFASYGTSLDVVLRKLDRLSAPPELGPAFLLQRSVVRRSVALCKEIASDLRAADLTAANVAIRRLFDAAATLSGPAGGRAARSAVRAYRKQLALIAKLSTRVQEDRTQLVAEVG